MKSGCASKGLETRDHNTNWKTSNNYLKSRTNIKSDKYQNQASDEKSKSHHGRISKPGCHSRRCSSTSNTNTSSWQRNARKPLEQTPRTTSRPRLGLLARSSRSPHFHHNNHNFSSNNLSIHNLSHRTHIPKLRRQTRPPCLNLRRPHLLERLQQLRRLRPALTRFRPPLPQKRKALMGRPPQLTRRLLDFPRPQRSRSSILGTYLFVGCGGEVAGCGGER
jgi:hypothetical protein